MKSEIILIGAGGHAKVCIELIHAMGERVAYCVGDAGSADECIGVPVLHGDQHLSCLRSEGYERLFIGVGSNALRESLSIMAIGFGYQLVNAISPHAIVSPTARLGAGIAVMAGVVINADARIEDLAIINTGATIDHDCHIEKAAHIAPQCALAGNVSIGRHAFLGVGTKVIPEISIGEKVIIGAGGVVVSNIEKNVVAVGVPAQKIKQTI